MSEARESIGPTNEETAYEERDVRIVPIVWLAAAVAATIIIAALVLGVIYPRTTHEASSGPRHLFPQPRLQLDEAGDLRRFEARVADRLDSYGWVDRAHGIVHIPIAEAMKRAAAQGFPDWPGNRK